MRPQRDVCCAGASMICPCGVDTLLGKDGLCKSCRLIASTRRRMLYRWTPGMDESLKHAYRSTRRKHHLSQALTELQQHFRFPRYIIANRAVALGLKRYEIRRWTAEELVVVQDKAGSLSTKQIGKLVNRSSQAIRSKIAQMGSSAAIADGFSRKNLCELFGVRFAVVDRWIGRDWLQINRDDRIEHSSVVRFLWEHMDEYRFSSCEEWWLKMMLQETLRNRRRTGTTHRNGK